MRLNLEHFVDHETKKVWFKCSNSITATAIPQLTNKYYPGYSGHIASNDYFDKLTKS